MYLNDIYDKYNINVFIITLCVDMKVMHLLTRIFFFIQNAMSCNLVIYFMLKYML